MDHNIGDDFTRREVYTPAEIAQIRRDWRQMQLSNPTYKHGWRTLEGTLHVPQNPASYPEAGPVDDE